MQNVGRIHLQKALELLQSEGMLVTTGMNKAPRIVSVAGRNLHRSGLIYHLPDHKISRRPDSHSEQHDAHLPPAAGPWELQPVWWRHAHCRRYPHNSHVFVCPHLLQDMQCLSLTRMPCEKWLSPNEACWSKISVQSYITGPVLMTAPWHRSHNLPWPNPRRSSLFRDPRVPLPGAKGCCRLPARSHQQQGNTQAKRANLTWAQRTAFALDLMWFSAVAYSVLRSEDNLVFQIYVATCNTFVCIVIVPCNAVILVESLTSSRRKLLNAQFPRLLAGLWILMGILLCHCSERWPQPVWMCRTRSNTGPTRQHPGRWSPRSNSQTSSRSQSWAAQSGPAWMSHSNRKHRPLMWEPSADSSP